MTNARTSDPLARAIAYLGAVEVAPGFYAYDDGRGGMDWKAYSVADTFAMRDLGANFDLRHKAASVGAWERMSKPSMMPAWWTPEKRFAWRYTDRVTIGAGLRYLQEPTRHREQFERITADLTTGEEIPAC